MISGDNAVGTFLGTTAYEVHTEPRVIETVEARVVSERQQQDNYMTSDPVFLVKDTEGNQRGTQAGHLIFGLPMINAELETAARCSVGERERLRYSAAPENGETEFYSAGKMQRDEYEALEAQGIRGEHTPATIEKILPFDNDHDRTRALLRPLGTIFIDRGTTAAYRQPTYGAIEKQTIPLSILLHGEQRHMRNIWRYSIQNGASVFLALKRTRDHMGQGFIDEKGARQHARATQTTPLQVAAVSKRDGSRVLHCSSSDGVPTQDDFDYLEDDKTFRAYTVDKYLPTNGPAKFIDWAALGKRNQTFVLDAYYEMGSPLAEFKCIRYTQTPPSDEGRAYIRRTNAIGAADASKFDALTNVNAITTCY